MLYSVIIVVNPGTTHIGRCRDGGTACSPTDNLCLQMINCQFLLPRLSSPVPRPPSPVNSEKLPVAGFRWRMEQGGALACSIRTGNDHSHFRQAPAGAASASQSARWPKAIPPPTQWVVSKCALSEISDKAHYPRRKIIREEERKASKIKAFSKNFSDYF